MRFVLRAAATLVLFAVGLPLQAEKTRVWEQTAFAHFAAGTADGVSIHSDGRITLAPRFERLYETPSAYLWSLAVDSEGNLFAGGGPDARVFRLGADGRKSTFFETDAVEIHAIAVDADDNVYAASSPQAKIFKIDPSGGYEVFYDPGVEYIWALVFDASGNLYAATGDEGQIHRIAPDGTGSVFVETGEVHVRSLALNAQGHLLAGTDPGGLIMRIDPAAPDGERTFVLHQAAKREITAITSAPDGSVYAAGVGVRTSTATGRKTPAPSPEPKTSARSGGSAVYRIAPDGSPNVIWQSSDESAFALAADEAGILIGTGDKGRLIRAESATSRVQVLATEPTQITALLARPGGGYYLATSNVGAIYQLGPGQAESGTFESSTYDARLVSQWGRLAFEGSADVAVEARTGNVLSTTKHWSPWSEAVSDPTGARLDVPNARFAQWRATLTGADATLDAARLFFYPANLAPELVRIELIPPNRRFAPKPVPAVQTRVSNLPPLSLSAPRRVATKPVAPLAITEKPGSMGARWLARDANGDTLRYRVEIRGEGETTWILLKDELTNAFLDWDTTGLADGRYEIRVTASDAQANPADRASEGSLISAPFLVDNTGPAIADLSATRTDGHLRIAFTAKDDASRIAAAECSIDGKDWKPVTPEGNLFDGHTLKFAWDAADPGTGPHTIAVRVRDERDNSASAKTSVP